MDKVKIDKRLLSPNKINLPIAVNENGILDEYIQTNDQTCLEVFTCSFCSCLAWDPVFCHKCDKPFCRACISKYGKNKKCPFGCESNSFREITRNEKNYLDKIKLKCTNVGCQKYVPYSEYINHLEKCQLRKYHCKNQSCKEEGYINDMINHSKICPNRLVPCTKCKQNIKFNEMKTHLQEFCPEVTIKCKLCGITMKRGIYIKEHKSDNNENVKCLKSQVEKWAKVYNDDIINKNKEIMELKNKLKEMEKNKKLIENENETLKKNIKEIKSFFKNGYSKFFISEKSNIENNFNLGSEDSKYSEMENNGKELLSTENSFYKRNRNDEIYKSLGSCEKKKVRFSMISKKAYSKDKERIRALKKVSSSRNLSNRYNNTITYDSSTHSSNNNPFK